MKFRTVAVTLLGIVVVVVAAGAGVIEKGRPAPGAPDGLLVTMQQLDANTRAAGEAIAAKNWPRVAELADQLNHHVEPPLGQKLRVMLWLRTQAPNFRGYDGKLRTAAVAMGLAARAGDAQAVSASYTQLQAACSGCHGKYQAAYIAHFHAGE